MVFVNLVGEFLCVHACLKSVAVEGIVHKQHDGAEQKCQLDRLDVFTSVSVEKVAHHVSRTIA